MNAPFRLPLAPQPRRKTCSFRLSHEDTVEIDIGHGFVAIIDAADLHLVSAYFWKADFKARNRKKVYAYAGHPKSSRIWLHKIILGIGADQIGDHIDRNTLNNRRSNLRIADHVGNNQNRVFRRGCAGFRGVSVANNTVSEAYIAKICHKCQRRHLGTFSTAEEAARAYDTAARRLHGEFAVLNYPEGAPC